MGATSLKIQWGKLVGLKVVKITQNYMHGKINHRTYHLSINRFGKPQLRCCDRVEVFVVVDLVCSQAKGGGFNWLAGIIEWKQQSQAPMPDHY